MTYTRTWAQMFDRARPGSHIGRVSEVVVHTEAGPDLSASATVSEEVGRLRDIDSYHRSLGWQGFGYSVMVCQSGRVYEGRGFGRSGAHTQGRNRTALAIVIPGHGDRTPMSDAAIAAARGWIADAIDAGALTPDPTISGHRDYAAKSCPGNRIYPQLDRLRAQEDNDLTPEQDKMLREVHRAVAGRDIGKDTQKLRLSLRYLVHRLGGKVKYDDQVPNRADV